MFENCKKKIRYQQVRLCFSVYLAKLLDHLFDADISILGHLALHVGEPLAELLVLFVEDGPLI